MQIPTKKLDSGFEMPIFGLGTWQMRGKTERDLQNDDEADIVAIRQAIDAGITHIDTAEMYAAGHAEELVGQGIQGYDRSKLFLTSKISPDHFAFADVRVTLEATLKRMQTDYLDLYLLHRPNPAIPIEQTMRALDILKDEELIKNIGVCNFTVERFEEAQFYAQSQIVANQLHLNLLYREPERKGLIEYCQNNDVMCIAWRPVQKGILTSSSNNPLLEELCQKYQKTPSQIAINWLISQNNIVTLSKMRSKEHLEENLGALGWQMDEEDIQKLDSEFPGQQDISDAVPLI